MDIAFMNIDKIVTSNKRLLLTAFVTDKLIDLLDPKAGVRLSNGGQVKPDEIKELLDAAREFGHEIGIKDDHFIQQEEGALSQAFTDALVEVFKRDKRGMPERLKAVFAAAHKKVEEEDERMPN